MGIESYDDEDLLEEVKHRGFKIEVEEEILMITPHGAVTKPKQVIIGGIRFELSN